MENTHFYYGIILYIYIYLRLQDNYMILFSPYEEKYWSKPNWP